jgi:hypothetical protein
VRSSWESILLFSAVTIPCYFRCSFAARLGVEPEQLALAAVADLIAAEGPDFDSAAQRVLEKNRELYRRLA